MAEVWQDKFMRKKGRNWSDDVTKMNEVLAKEESAHSLVEVYSP